MRQGPVWGGLAVAAGLSVAAAHAQGVPVPPAPPGAIAYMQSRNWLWAEAQLLLLAVPLFLLATGLGARMRTLCARLARVNRFWTLTLFAIAYLAFAALVLAPFDFYRDYWSLRGTSDFHDTAGAWVLKEIVSLLVKVVVAGLFIWIPYTLIRRSPKLWWLYAAAALVPVAFLVLAVLPVWVDPLT